MRPEEMAISSMQQRIKDIEAILINIEDPDYLLIPEALLKQNKIIHENIRRIAVLMKFYDRAGAKKLLPFLTKNRSTLADIFAVARGAAERQGIKRPRSAENLRPLPRRVS